MKALLKDYREWCGRMSAEPKDLGAFVEEVEGVCKKSRIKIEALQDKRVICRNVKLPRPQVDSRLQPEGPQLGARVGSFEFGARAIGSRELE